MIKTYSELQEKMWDIDDFTLTCEHSNYIWESLHKYNDAKKICLDCGDVTCRFCTPEYCHCGLDG